MPMANIIAVVAVFEIHADMKAVALGDLPDPARYTGSAGALTDRALERR